MSMTKPGKAILATAVTLTLVLLVAHTLKWTKLTVDNVTLALLGILFVLPFIESINPEVLQRFVSPSVARRTNCLCASRRSSVHRAMIEGTKYESLSR